MRNWCYDYGFVVVLVLLAVALFVGVFAVTRASCFAMTADIGMPSRWSIFGNCQIQLADQTWIPLDNYRLFGED